MNIIDLTAKKVGPDATFQYHCFRCGDCCRNVKESIMLTPWDLFKLAQFFDQTMVAIVEAYTVPVPIAEGLFPLLMLKTRSHGDTCVFYKDGCTVQEAKPIVCRLYPMNIQPGEHDGLSYYIVSQKPHHYTGETRRVGDWIKANLTPDDRQFMIKWFDHALELGRLMKKSGKRYDSKSARESLLISIILYMYVFYETDTGFGPQYERNMKALKAGMETDK